MQKSRYPAYPTNLMVNTTYTRSALDLVWDLPYNSPENKGKFPVGVNIYRSFNSPKGDYEKINKNIVAVNYYRDKLNYKLTRDEDLLATVINKGDSQAGEWIFKTQNPIVKYNSSMKTFANSYTDLVSFKVNGEEAKAYRVFGETGEIRLNTDGYFSLDSLNFKPFPTHIDSVTCSYYHVINEISFNLMINIYYRVTTVFEDGSESSMSPPSNVRNKDGDMLDMYWSEAVRRNRWILQQGGDRGLLLIRKRIGIPCSCDKFYRTQADSSCDKCFGVGIEGGFEYPFETIFAQSSNPTSLEFDETGKRINFSYDSWATNYPMLADGDVFIKKDNRRYLLSSITSYEHRGTVKQYSFSLTEVPTTDIIYKLQIPGQENYPMMGIAQQKVYGKKEIPDSVSFKGKSSVFSNIEIFRRGGQRREDPNI